MARYVSLVVVLGASACGSGPVDAEGRGEARQELLALDDGAGPCALDIQADSHASVGNQTSATAVNPNPGSGYGWTITPSHCVANVSGENSTTVVFTPTIHGCTLKLELTEFPQPSGCQASRRMQTDFLDVPNDPAHHTYPFHEFIDNIAGNGITAGCGNGNYCPQAETTRAQMAVFLLKAEEGIDYFPPPCSGSSQRTFADVPATSPFCPWIEELARREITAGCGVDVYCPGLPTTRAQMAVFLLKTRLGPSYRPDPCIAGQERFDDVPASSPFCPWIEDLARRNITVGCAPTSYCPGNPVLREQMAVFLVKTFGLTFP